MSSEAQTIDAATLHAKSVAAAQDGRLPDNVADQIASEALSEFTVNLGALAVNENWEQLAQFVQAVIALDAAAAADHLLPSAVDNIRTWLREPWFVNERPTLVDELNRGDWQTLNDVFWTIIPFGTGGRRGRMHPVGTNAINDRTIGESAQGLAACVQELFPGEKHSCAIAYDTRHRSRHFAELCAEILAAAGFQVHFLDGHRSTPELSTAVMHLQATCGIMVTASHNPPSDNAVKVYWQHGAQLLSPEDQQVIDHVKRVTWIERKPFAEAVAAGEVRMVQDEIDAFYLDAVASQSRFDGGRELKILYSPMHGVGQTSVVPVLTSCGFENLEVFGPHAEPNGDFPNVPDHVANPENPATFDSMIAHAGTGGADLILATDPDADRLGCAVKSALDGSWITITGNQTCALLTDFTLSTLADQPVEKPFVVTTLVTTGLIRRVAESYGAEVIDNLQVGFKWICSAVRQRSPAVPTDWREQPFAFGCEESYGYLAGTHVRDKDAAVAALLLSELAAQLHVEGKSLHHRLIDLFRRHGLHRERTVSQYMHGAAGMQQMQKLMETLRSDPPDQIGGMRIIATRDYLGQPVRRHAGNEESIDGIPGNLVIFELEHAGNHVAIRPSGTEPKVKLYMFAYQPPDALSDDVTAEEKVLDARLDALESDLRAFAEKFC